jgi:hypothetical protein
MLATARLLHGPVRLAFEFKGRLDHAGYSGIILDNQDTVAGSSSSAE